MTDGMTGAPRDPASPSAPAGSSPLPTVSGTLAKASNAAAAAGTRWSTLLIGTRLAAAGHGKAEAAEVAAAAVGRRRHLTATVTAGQHTPAAAAAGNGTGSESGARIALLCCLTV